MKAITTCLIAAAICIGVGASHHLDAGLDGQAERAQAQDIEQALRDAEQAARTARAAYALCKADHGPNVLPAWTLDGQLICQPKRGQASVIQVAKAAP